MGRLSIDLRVASLFFISAFLTTLGAAAQSLSGSVVEAMSATPIPGAHVVALSLPDSVVAAFSIADGDGRFNIRNAPAPPCLLRVSCLGYSTTFSPVNSLPVTGLSIPLTPKAFDLAEIAVRKRAPGAVVKGDTVKYNVAKYVDGTEQVLGEVLGKLPGVEVDESGTVSAGGKKVDKLLLNGQDFAGERHDMLTKNMPSDMVAKVELINNYNEYSQLDGFQSKGTALNIGVDSAYTRRPTGNAELWGGFRDKYRAKANLFVIGDEAMLGLNAKAFNTGEEAMSLIDYMELCGGVKNFAQAISGRTSAVERPTGSSASYLAPDESTRRRDDQLITANVAWNPSETLKINSYAVFNREAAKAESGIRRTFLAHPDVISTLRQSSRAENSIANLNADIKCVLPRKGIVAYRGSVACASSDDKLSSDFRGSQRWAADDQSFHTEHDISLTQNIGSRRLLTVRAYALADRGDASASVATDSMLLPVAAVGRVGQDVGTDVTMAGASAAFVSKVGRKLQVRAFAAFDFDRVDYDSESDAPELRTPHSVGRCAASTLGVSLRKPKGKFQFEAGAQAVNVSSRNSRVGWKLLPHASVEVELSQLNSLSITYETSLARDGNAPFASSARMTDYRTLALRPSRDEMLHLSQSLSLVYMLFDPLSDVLCTLSAGVSSEADPVGSDYRSLAGGGVTVERVAAGKDNLLAYANVYFRKGFSIPLSLRLKASGTHSSDADLYEGVRADNVVDDVKSRLSLTTKFRKPVNVEVGCGMGWRRIDVGIAGAVSVWRSGSVLVQPVVVSPGKRLTVKIPVSFVVDRAGGESVEYADLGLFASFSVHRHLSLFAEGRDILHSDSRDRIVTSQSDDHVDVATEGRMPGFVIAGLKLIF